MIKKKQQTINKKNIYMFYFNVTRSINTYIPIMCLVITFISVSVPQYKFIILEQKITCLVC